MVYYLTFSVAEENQKREIERERVGVLNGMNLIIEGMNRGGDDAARTERVVVVGVVVLLLLARGARTDG